METCWDLWLKKQLEIIRPKVVVTLGRHSMARFFPQETISRVHGKPRMLNGILFYPMYHPAAALHQQQLRDTLIQDMRALPKAIQEAQSRAKGPDKPAEKPPMKNNNGEDGPRQLSML
jgi:DNA polymerase